MRSIMSTPSFVKSSGSMMSSLATKMPNSIASRSLSTAVNSQHQLSQQVALPPIGLNDAWTRVKAQPRLFAIVSVHGQQFKVSPNDLITFNRLKVTVFFLNSATSPTDLWCVCVCVAGG